ncbi:MAG: hypothetical protein C4576_09220 [Desulfobacteraceae bacterium]|nr:MAG: hypothetical protein C4576_09220 [Desulfobacteraceae bacterium]
MNQTAEENVIVYVLYPSGHDITGQQDPVDLKDPSEQTRQKSMAEYLRWERWLWGFQDLEDYLGLVNPLVLTDQLIYVLSAPQDSIRWCAFIRQSAAQREPEDIIFPDPETIRAMDDKPLALIKCPIEREWIKAMFPARELLLAGRVRA